MFVRCYAVLKASVACIHGSCGQFIELSVRLSVCLSLCLFVYLSLSVCRSGYSSHPSAQCISLPSHVSASCSVMWPVCLSAWVYMPDAATICVSVTRVDASMHTWPCARTCVYVYTCARVRVCALQDGRLDFYREEKDYLDHGNPINKKPFKLWQFNVETDARKFARQVTSLANSMKASEQHLGGLMGHGVCEWEDGW